MAKWRKSFYEHAAHKEDFANVAAMHDLLVSRQFRFPEVPQEDLDAIVNAESMLNPEQAAAAEKERLSAKLDFLLLRGSIADLNAANDLMKQLVDYQDDDEDDEGQDDLGKVGSIEKPAQDDGDEEFLQEVSDRVDLLENIVDPMAFRTTASVIEMYEDAKAALPRLLNLQNSFGKKEEHEAVSISLIERIRALVRGVEAKSAPSLNSESIRDDKSPSSHSSHYGNTIHSINFV